MGRTIERLCFDQPQGTSLRLWSLCQPRANALRLMNIASALTLQQFRRWWLCSTRSSRTELSQSPVRQTEPIGSICDQWESSRKARSTFLRFLRTNELGRVGVPPKNYLAKQIEWTCDFLLPPTCAEYRLAAELTKCPAFWEQPEMGSEKTSWRVGPTSGRFFPAESVFLLLRGAGRLSGN